MRISTPSSDRTLERTIARRLESATVIGADSVVVTVDNGRVVLSGFVGSFSERLMCLEVAVAVAGSGAVISELHVRPYDDGWQLGRGATPVLPRQTDPT